jgi:hypothetical protein
MAVGASSTREGRQQHPAQRCPTTQHCRRVVAFYFFVDIDVDGDIEQQQRDQPRRYRQGKGEGQGQGIEWQRERPREFGEGIGPRVAELDVASRRPTARPRRSRRALPRSSQTQIGARVQVFPLALEPSRPFPFPFPLSSAFAFASRFAAGHSAFARKRHQQDRRKRAGLSSRVVQLFRIDFGSDVAARVAADFATTFVDRVPQLFVLCGDARSQVLFGDLRPVEDQRPRNVDGDLDVDDDDER